MKKIICTVMILISHISIAAHAETDCTIIVKEPAFGEKIAFILTPINEPRIPPIKSDRNSLVKIRSNILADQKYIRTLFKFDFSSTLAKKLYVKKLVRGSTPVPERFLNSESGYYLKDLCVARNGYNQLTVEDLERGRKAY